MVKKPVTHQLDLAYTHANKEARDFPYTINFIKNYAKLFLFNIIKKLPGKPGNFFQNKILISKLNPANELRVRYEV